MTKTTLCPAPSSCVNGHSSDVRALGPASTNGLRAVPPACSSVGTEHVLCRPQRCHHTSHRVHPGLLGIDLPSWLPPFFGLSALICPSLLLESPL